jgi:hypothetical protein
MPDKQHSEGIFIATPDRKHQRTVVLIDGRHIATLGHHRSSAQ